MTDIVVSGSELDTFALCRRKHTYAFGMKLGPKQTPRALAIGTAGHALLVPYYEALASGATHREACAQAEAVASWRALTAGVDPDIADFALWLVRTFWAVYPFDAADWRVAAVEHTIRVPLVSGITYAGTVDLLVYDQAGLHLIDHRFLGRFYDPDLVVIDPQMPRYALALGELGYPVARASRNMILTASSTTKMSATRRVSRIEIPLDSGRLATARSELYQVAGQLAAFRQLPLEHRRLTAPRTFHASVCRFCPFARPCAVSAAGGDDSVLLEQHYQKSSYGYE